uniref:Uncharacterized protein n=1 Tax=Caenorhabditis japonica TaxID=281687 RepID=A0A8R1ELP8_CAEJA
MMIILIRRAIHPEVVYGPLSQVHHCYETAVFVVDLQSYGLCQSGIFDQEGLYKKPYKFGSTKLLASEGMGRA